MSAAITKLSPAPPPARTLAIPEDEAIRVLGNSLYPGARPESIRLVLAWCKATGRDPMKKPIHIVPMWVKDAITGQGGMRDVLMPGIGTYRTDAANSGAYAGKSEPEFGPDVNGSVGTVRMTYPRWCKVSVERIVAGQVRRFTATEFWLENYATAGRDKDEPNAMWRKRPYGQLAKCAEAQALRMAFPDETGNTNTQEEMDGKTFDGMTVDAVAEREPSPVTPTPAPPAGTRRTFRQILDETAGMLSACDSLDCVVAVGEIPAVLYILEHGSPVVKAEMNNLLSAAFTRWRTDPNPGTAESVAAEADDDEFPGDR